MEVVLWHANVLQCRWLDKDNAQANYNKRALPFFPPHGLTGLTLPSSNNMRSFAVSSPLPPHALAQSVLSFPTFMQAFHLAHPVGSSSGPPTSMSLSPQSLKWYMLIRPFKEIVDRLAHFWPNLSINLSVNLPSPLRLGLSLWISPWDVERGC